MRRTWLFVFLSVLCVCSLVFAEAEQTDVTYPLFKQKGQTWSSDIMYSDDIATSGCTMSSVSMALNGRGYVLDGGVSINPGSLNAYLRDKSGYTSSDLLIWGTVEGIDPDTIDYLGKGCGVSGCSAGDQAALNSDLENDIVCIGNVNGGGHWVLVKKVDATDPTRYHVNDPGAEKYYFDFLGATGILNWARYQMKLPPVINPDVILPTYPYPSYPSCGESWSNDIMTTSTLCQMGSLVSGIAMAMAGRGYKIEGQAPDPGNLNTYLKGNDGYDSDLFKWVGLDNFDSSLKFQVRLKTKQETNWIIEQIADHYVVLGHLEVGYQKWCLLLDHTDGDDWSVNCPEEPTKQTKGTSDFQGFMIFSMQEKEEKSSGDRLMSSLMLAFAVFLLS